MTGARPIPTVPELAAPSPGTAPEADRRFPWAIAEGRDLYNGFGDALARAFEMVVTPAIFGWFGWLLDHRLDTTPLFTVAFTLVVFGYVAWRLWGTYEQRMRAEESQLGLGRGKGASGG